MENDNSMDPYLLYVIIGLILASWHLCGGILIILFYGDRMTETFFILFNISWLSLYMSMLCLLYYLIIPEKEFYIISEEQYKKYLEKGYDRL